MKQTTKFKLKSYFYFSFSLYFVLTLSTYITQTYYTTRHINLSSYIITSIGFIYCLYLTTINITKSINK